MTYGIYKQAMMAKRAALQKRAALTKRQLWPFGKSKEQKRAEEDQRRLQAEQQARKAAMDQYETNRYAEEEAHKSEPDWYVDPWTGRPWKYPNSGLTYNPKVDPWAAKNSPFGQGGYTYKYSPDWRADERSTPRDIPMSYYDIAGADVQQENGGFHALYTPMDDTKDTTEIKKLQQANNDVTSPVSRPGAPGNYWTLLAQELEKRGLTAEAADIRKDLQYVEDKVKQEKEFIYNAYPEYLPKPSYPEPTRPIENDHMDDTMDDRAYL